MRGQTDNLTWVRWDYGGWSGLTNAHTNTRRERRTHIYKLKKQKKKCLRGKKKQNNNALGKYIIAGKPISFKTSTQF